MAQITVTLTDLLEIPTLDEIAQRLIAQLQAATDANGNNPFNVNDYSPGSIPKTIIDMLSSGLLDYAAVTAPRVAGGSFLDDAIEKWLTLHVEQLFDINRTDPTITEQKVLMWFDDLIGPTTKAAGFFIIESPTTGNRYRNKNPVTVPVGTVPRDTVEAIFVAEGPGAQFSDGAGTLTKLITPLPGLNVANEQTDFTDVILIGTSQGTIDPVRTVPATPPNPHTIRITITLSGQVGAGALEYEIDGNGVKIAVSPIPATLIVKESPGGPNSGTSVDFTDHVSVTPSFIGGSVFSFVTPAGPITQQGRDEESDPSLRARARGRWSGLSEVPNNDRFAQWAFEASNESNLGITKVKVKPDLLIAGEADVIIAGDVNPLPVSAQTTVQDYIDQRLSITDRADVRLANTISVNAVGTVKVVAADLLTVQAAADKNWADYITALAIGGDARQGGVVGIDDLVSAVMKAGAISINGEVLSATARSTNAEGNLVLVDDDVAAVAAPLSTALTWQTV